MFPKMGVQAIVKGIDDYLRDVGKMEKANENFNEEVGKVGTGKLAQFGAGAKDALTGLGIAGGIAAGGVLAVREAYQKTIAVTVAYNKNILDTANALGTTTEEYSRIVQVADDFGISQDTVNAALEMVTKKDFTVTIDSLAELADRTNAILDPTKRAAELAEVFGRGWGLAQPASQDGRKEHQGFGGRDRRFPGSYPGRGRRQRGIASSDRQPQRLVARPHADARPEGHSDHDEVRGLPEPGGQRIGRFQ